MNLDTARYMEYEKRIKDLVCEKVIKLVYSWITVRILWKRSILKVLYRW